MSLNIFGMRVCNPPNLHLDSGAVIYLFRPIGSDLDFLLVRRYRPLEDEVVQRFTPGGRQENTIKYQP